MEAPDGTTKDGWAEQHAHQTVLQQHCEFFDPDNDGVIWPLDTYNSFRKLGFGIFLSVLSTFIINGNFAYATQSSWIPDLRFPIYLKNIHKDKHGSDSGTYDHEGRFVPQHFEEIFVKYAGGKDYLTASDLFNLWNCRRVFGDFFGWGGGLFECRVLVFSLLIVLMLTRVPGLATYLMVWPADGRITKEQIRKMYDGSLFYEIAEQRSREQADARAGRRKAY